MSTSKLTRRNVLWGLGGVVLGGAVATSTGLGLWHYRRLQQAKRRAARRVNRAPKPTDGWVLTDADQQAIQNADTLAESDTLDILNEVDLVGGDYEERAVSSLQSCVTACETDARCEAFTYARSSHPLPDKRQMCWLKSDVPETRVDGAWHYLSGVRKGS